jgi:hypothetical protein
MQALGVLLIILSGSSLIWVAIMSVGLQKMPLSPPWASDEFARRVEDRQIRLGKKYGRALRLIWPLAVLGSVAGVVIILVGSH